MKPIIRFFEITRMCCVFVGMLLAYQAATPDKLYWLTLLVVIPLTGFTALESLLFGTQAAEAKQRETGSDYQTQSALNNLATAVTAIIVLLFHLGLNAQLTVIVMTLLFFVFSSIKHLLEYCIDKKHAIHLQRFILTALLLIFCLPLIWQAMQ